MSMLSGIFREVDPSKRGEFKYLLPLFFLTILVMVVFPASLAQESDGRLKVLYMGLVDNRLNPLRDWLSSEPGISFSMVPSRLFKGSWTETHGTAFKDEIRRYLRIYFPRSYSKLRSYDAIHFSSILVNMYTQNQLDLLVRSIRDGGACAIADTGGVMGKNYLMYGPWADSPVSEVFPCDSDATASYFKNREAPNIDLFHVELNRELPPVFTPFLEFGLEKWRGHGGRIMLPKNGVNTWGWMHFSRQMSEKTRPWVLSWEYGNAMTWSVADAPRYPFWSSYERGWSDNEFGKDMWFNMMYLGTGREIVTDVMLVHSARQSFASFRQHSQNLLSLADFIQKFGANVGPLMDDIEELNSRTEEARNAYIAQNYQEAREMMEEFIEELHQLSQEGIKLRQGALMWVYIIEWITVTGVGLVTGFVVYSLMIGRRFYREAELTSKEG